MTNIDTRITCDRCKVKSQLSDMEVIDYPYNAHKWLVVCKDTEACQRRVQNGSR